jgi:hypothetical protein
LECSEKEICGNFGERHPCASGWSVSRDHEKS